MTAPIAPRPLQIPDGPTPPASMFSAMHIAASGLSAQSFKMEVIAQNLANVETTRTPGGGPYQRRTVTLQADPGPLGDPAGTSIGAWGAGADLATPATGAPTPAGIGDATLGQVDTAGGVRIASVGVDQTAGPMVYDPGHPDADKNGYVHMPNVNMTDELMDLMTSRRLFQANATVFEVAKSMLNQATQI
ncbi:MAG TPA: flagellar basal body rod protein FlgC [Gemmatimonadaceae bacterium]|nr:flagellar basal body rod protein FlgC [Gemmatimonadaceae bacterium]